MIAPCLPALCLAAVDGVRVEDLFVGQLELVFCAFYKRAMKAGHIAEVALPGLHGHLQQHAVLVAVRENLLDLLEVAAQLSLRPQLPARPAVEGTFARFDGSLERLAIHICEHQYPARLCILYDGRNQAVLAELGKEFMTDFDIV